MTTAANDAGLARTIRDGILGRVIAKHARQRAPAMLRIEGVDMPPGRGMSGRYAAKPIRGMSGRYAAKPIRGMSGRYAAMPLSRQIRMFASPPER